MRLRRARTILAYWKKGQLVFENYRTRISVAADPLAAQLLHLLNVWRRPDQIVRALAQYSPASVRKSLRQLTSHTLLVRQGTTDAANDEKLEKVWSSWLPHGSLHFASKDVPFVHGKRRERLMRRFLAESRQPPFFKSYPRAPRITLPPSPPEDSEFLRVLLSRRTHRAFSTTPLTLSALSKLLFYTWGVKGYLSTPFGNLPFKTSPSGGARHPIEVYVLALNVRGLSPGLYHYDSRKHFLRRLRRGSTPTQAAEYCAGLQFVKHAAALFLMTAVFPRSMWKYRFSRAYRVVTLDAGHLCQTFCLTATYLGLAPFCTAALKDTRIERDLGIDGISESAVYVAGVGLPLKRPGRHAQMLDS